MSCDFSSYDRVITIEVRTPGFDAEGGATQTWATLAEPWANVGFDRGRELERAQKIDARVDTVFKMFFSSEVSGVNPGDNRIVLDSEVYEVLAALPLPGGRPEELVIHARRGDNG